MFNIFKKPTKEELAKLKPFIHISMDIKTYPEYVYKQGDVVISLCSASSYDYIRDLTSKDIKAYAEKITKYPSKFSIHRYNLAGSYVEDIIFYTAEVLSILKKYAYLK